VLRLAADENLPLAVVRGLLRLLPEIDIVRVQDAALRGATDPTILAWAASEERLLEDAVMVSRRVQARR